MGINLNTLSSSYDIPALYLWAMVYGLFRKVSQNTSSLIKSVEPDSEKFEPGCQTQDFSGDRTLWPIDRPKDESWLVAHGGMFGDAYSVLTVAPEPASPLPIASDRP